MYRELWGLFCRKQLLASGKNQNDESRVGGLENPNNDPPESSLGVLVKRSMELIAEESGDNSLMTPFTYM